MKKNKCEPKRKIAIFTDAHSLYEPTKAILDDINKKKIKEIYSLGDNVGIGPNPKETMDLLEKYKVISIAGNYEDAINFGTNIFSNYLSKEKIDNINWTKKQLTEKQLETIRNFPHFIELNIAKNKVALCHFPNDVRCDYIFHNSRLYLLKRKFKLKSFKQFLYTNSKKHIKQIAKKMKVNIARLYTNQEIYDYLKIYSNNNKISSNLLGFVSYIKNPLFIHNGLLKKVKDYNLIISGHTHFSAMEKTNTTNYLSIRSVGMGYNKKDKNKAQYIIINEYEDNYSIETVNVIYDRISMEKNINNFNIDNKLLKKYVKM